LDLSSLVLTAKSETRLQNRDDARMLGTPKGWESRIDFRYDGDYGVARNQEVSMKTISAPVLFSLLVFFTGCASLRTGGEVQYGRQALLAGKSELALGYFYSAAQMDPDFVYATGSSPKQSVWSYVGRTEYLTGRLPQARQALERAIAGNREEDIARLYLGLTLAREGDREQGLKQIESGMRGINNFLDYINQAQRYSIGQYWDPDRDIRRAIEGNLAMISGKDVNWQQLTAETEWLGIRMEEESDLARKQEAQARSRDGGRGSQP
jgi:tetratricopeptide (TPR) repeat protein